MLTDLGELKTVMDELIVEGVSLEITGFAMDEVDQIVLDGQPAVHEKSPLEPNANTEPTARSGDVFQLGMHRLICGDARNASVLRSVMASDHARMIFIDEPYSVPMRGP